MLKIAIQKSGRLFEGSIKLLNECGLKIDQGKNALTSRASGFEAEILFLRDDDIPRYVSDGVADLGIVGQNVLVEKQTQCKTLLDLGFSRCRLSLAIPRNQEYHGIEWFEGKKIATSYPFITKQFLAQRGVSADTHEISGSVEIAPAIGLADAISDLVSTGSTLLGNGLKEVQVVLQSEAVLVGYPFLSEEKMALTQQLIFRIQTVLNANNNKYILLNAPEDKLQDVIQLLPGMRSPTIMPLAEKGWFSVHSVISEYEFWNRIDRLKALGAEGILIIPIEKMML